MTENTVNAPAPKTLADMLAELRTLQAEQRAKSALIGSPVVASAGRSIDALGSPIGAGTNAMHRVLAEAFAQGVWLSRKQIIELSGYTNTPNHLNTMRTKGRVVSGLRGEWRLSDTAALVWHGEGRPFGFATLASVETSPVSTGEVALTAEVPAIGLTSVENEAIAKLAEAAEVAGEKGEPKGKKGKRRAE